VTKEAMIEMLQTLPDGVEFGPTVTGLPGHFAILGLEGVQIGHLDFFSSPRAPYVEIYEVNEECYPCPHGGTHGSDYCRLCEQNTGEDEGPAYCREHDS
jgi:hypothetical protein